jgi:asparaginyl-tRNA synthetase
MKTDLTSLDNICKQVGRKVTIEGWITNCKDSGNLIIWEIRDGTGFVSVQIPIANHKENLITLKSVSLETYVRLTGDVINTQDGIIIYSSHVQILHSMPLSLTNSLNRHLNIRNKRYWAILRIKDEILNRLNLYLRQRGYHLVQPPILIPSVSERIGEFSVKHYDDEVKLSSSAALYMGALCLGFGKVYSIHPVFRKEKETSKRHLSEFWMLEVETINQGLENLMQFIESLIKNVVNSVLVNRKQELAILDRDLKSLNSVKEKFNVLEYKDAVNALKTLGCIIDDGEDLQKHEEVLSKMQEGPIFIVHFPKKVGSWTAKPYSDKSSKSLNLLLPEGYGEAIEGCERITDYKLYEEKFKMAQVEGLHWYIDVNKYGYVLRSGFGLGIERLCMWICGVDDIKDTVAFPRDRDNFFP